jgi:hypothetical protein
LPEPVDGRTLDASNLPETIMKPLLMLLGALALGACSSKPPAPVAKAPPVATPFDAMRADEQRAKDVQKTVDRQAEEQRRQIEAAQQ